MKTLRLQLLIILCLPVLFISSVYANANANADLTGAELMAFIAKAEKLEFDERDEHNSPVKTAEEQITLAKLFDFDAIVERIKSELGIKPYNNSSLTVFTASVLPTPPLKRFGFNKWFELNLPIITWILNPQRKSILKYILVKLSGVYGHVPSWGWCMILISLILLTLFTLPSKAEPRFRFEIQLE